MAFRAKDVRIGPVFGVTVETDVDLRSLVSGLYQYVERGRVLTAHSMKCSVVSGSPVSGSWRKKPF